MKHAQRPTFEELRDRVVEGKDACKGTIGREVALVWEGYFAALIEWGLLSVEDHQKLSKLLPETQDSPVMGIYLGWKREDS